MLPHVGTLSAQVLTCLSVCGTFTAHHTCGRTLTCSGLRGSASHSVTPASVTSGLVRRFIHTCVKCSSTALYKDTTYSTSRPFRACGMSFPCTCRYFMLRLFIYFFVLSAGDLYPCLVATNTIHTESEFTHSAAYIRLRLCPCFPAQATAQMLPPAWPMP